MRTTATKQIFLLILSVFGLQFIYAQNSIIDEGFETWPPQGWVLEPESGISAWRQDDGTDNGPGSAYEGQYAAFFDFVDFSGGNRQGTIITPSFDLTSMNNPELSFYWWNNSSTAADLKPRIEILTSDDGINFTLLEGFNTHECGLSWVHYSRILHKSVKKIKIMAIREQWATANTFIDAFTLSEGPACAGPVDQKFSLLDSDGEVLLSWLPVNEESKWNLKVSSTPIDPDEATADIVNNAVIEGEGRGEYLVPGLEVGKTYYWYVRTDCGASVSEWTIEKSFLVDAAPAVVPFYADFENGFDGFTLVQEGQTNRWVHGSLPLEGTGREGTCLFVSKDGGTSYEYDQNTRDRSHIYRQIKFPEDAPKGFELSFDWRCVGDIYNNVMKAYIITDLGVYPEAGEWVHHQYQVGPYIQGSDNWKNIKIELPASLAGTNGRLVFSWMNNDDKKAQQPPIALDNVSIEVLQCRTPINLSVSDITKTSAKLYWEQEGESSGSWQIEYGEYGFTPGSGIKKTVSSNPYMLNDLAPGTDYQVYVQGICEDDIISQYSKPAQFPTLCNSLSADYSSDFNDFTSAQLPLCWRTITENGMVAIVSGGAYVRSAPYALALNNANGTESDFLALVSPEFEGLSDMNKRIKFWATINKPIISLRVGVMSDPTDKETYVELYKINTVDLVDIMTGMPVMKPFVFNLNSPLITDQHKHIVLRQGNELFMTMASIDDFVYETIPDFVEPQNLTLTSLGVNSAIIEWGAGSGENNWEYVYGEYGFDPDAATDIQEINKPVAMLENLESNVKYEIYVRGVSGDERSGWSFPIYFTPCLSDIIPYSQDFENGYGVILPMSCWNVESNTGNPWHVRRGVFYAGLNSLCVEGTGLDEWVFSPGLEMNKSKTYELSFYYKTMSGSTKDHLRVGVGNAPLAGNMRNLLDLIDVTQWDYDKASVKFTVPESGYYYVGFHALSQNGSGFSIDDMLITETTPVSIDKETNNGIITYPNPAKDILRITVDGAADIEIYNSLGSLVKTVHEYRSDELIHIRDLHPGVYLIRVKQGAESRSVKIIIMN